MTTRIAVAGAGLIGKRHIWALDLAHGAGLAAVIDPMPQAAEVAAAAGVPHYLTLADMPQEAADGVVLATPNQAHHSGALECIARGLPVLVEKPIATTLAEARAIVRAGEAAGVPVLTGHHRRHNPLIAKAKELIDQGAIGRPLSVQGMFWLAKPDDYFDVAWRRAPGAGPVYLNLVHDIDLMRHLLGEVTAVQAMENNAARGNAVEDTCVIVLEFASGVLGTVNVSDAIPAPWSWELTAGENPDYAQTDQACYTIGGSKGALELPRLRLWRHQGDAGWWSPISATTPPIPRAEPLVRQMEQFSRVIALGERPVVSGREGMKTLQVIEAIKCAARDKCRQTISDEE